MAPGGVGRVTGPVCHVPSASAILDRFLQLAEIVTFQGRSYRLKDRQAPDDTKPASVSAHHNHS